MDAYLSGEIDSYDNNIYYAGYGNHYLKKYSSNGELLFSRIMVEEITKPFFDSNVVNGNERLLKISDEFKPAAQSLVVYQNKIYVLYRGNNTELSSRILDVYDSNSGDYLYSLKISNKDRKAYRFDIDRNGVIYSLEDMLMHSILNQDIHQ